MIERYIIKRSEVSACVANKELQYLRALFNYGIKRKLIIGNPTDDIEFLPVEIKKKYVPSKDDVLKVISVADPDTQTDHGDDDPQPDGDHGEQPEEARAQAPLPRRNPVGASLGAAVAVVSQCRHHVALLDSCPDVVPTPAQF